MARLKGWRVKLFGTLALALGMLFWRSLGAASSEAKALTEPVIQHAALECIPQNQFAIASAVIEPGEEVRTARVYFRSDKYPDFYYVDMEGVGNDFKAIFPMPSEETERVIYYVEAVSLSFDSARTAEHDPIVTEDSDCRRRDPIAAWFTGDDPGIVVGATVAGAPQVPPGFQALGISGFVTAAGAVSSTGAGGGIGAGTIAIAGAGAAGAAALAVAAAGGDASTTTTTAAAGPGPSTTTTTAAGTTTTSASGPNTPPVACFTMDPPTAVVKVGETVRLDARCSTGDQTGDGDGITNYEWNLGDGRIRSGPDQAFITPQWSTAGVYTITLTVTDSGGAGLHNRPQRGFTDSIRKEITVEEVVVLEACFDASSPTVGFFPPCDYVFDASCSTGPIGSYDWVIDVNGAFPPGPISKSGKVVSQSWGITDCGLGTNKNISVRLTVTGDAGSRDSVTQPVNIKYLTSPFARQQTVATSFTSYLGVAPFDGSVRGDVVLNGVHMDGTDSATPFNHQVQGMLGDNTIEAYTTVPMDGPGFWRFDFRGAAHFVSGSLKILSGQIVAVGADHVVFRLSGTAGERVKFTFQILP